MLPIWNLRTSAHPRHTNKRWVRDCSSGSLEKIQGRKIKEGICVKQNQE
jgi:hypothetical protein